MKHLVEFPLKEGGSVVVEVDEPETSGTIRAARGDMIAKASETLEDALSKVVSVAKVVIERLHTIEHKPDEIEVSFGVKLNTAAGVVIASASAEANFDVTLRWAEKKDEVAATKS